MTGGDLLPFCYRTAQYEAAHGMMKAMAGARKRLINRIDQYEVVCGRIIFAELQNRCSTTELTRL
jgi:hypothetical protein